MKLVKVSSLFEVKYGVNLELNKLTLDDEGINFVSRTANNNGVSAKVKLLPNLKPIEAGVLTVAGGGSVAETFLQPAQFYSGRDLYYLRPRMDLTDEQKLFYCMCIRANKYRFNYGRQANRTLKDLMIPAIDQIPSWVDGLFDGVVNEWRKRLGGVIEPTEVPPAATTGTPPHPLAPPTAAARPAPKPRRKS